MTMESIAVVLAGPSGPSLDVMEVLEGWVASGLIRPSIWAQRDSLTGEAGTELLGHLLEGSDRRTISILDELAHRDLRTVRVVAVHLCANQEPDQTLVEHTKCAVQTLRPFLAANQRLEQLNIIVPATGSAGLDPGLVDDAGVKHLVVSPEDRANDRQVSRAISWPDQGYAEHAALALATIAGLWWSTGGVGPFDNEEFTASAERSQLVVTRSFARILKAESLSEDVTRELFRRRRAEAWTVAAVEGVDAPNPDQLMEELAGRISELDNGAIAYKPATPLPRPEAQRVSVWQAFRMLLGFLVGKLAQAPGQIADRVSESMRRALEDFAQHATFGEDSSVEVGFGGRTRIGAEDRFPSMLAADYATLLLRDLRRNTTQPATAELWRGLRQVAFGLIDAGPFPAAIDAPTDGSRRIVVNDGTRVVADPRQTFVIDRSVLPAGVDSPAWACMPIPGWDVGRLQALRRLLANAVTRSEQQGGASSDEVEAFPASDSAPPPPPPPPPRASTGKPKPSDGSPASLEALVHELDEFAEQHHGSLLWQVSERLGRSLASASDAFRDALRKIREGAPAEDVDRMHLAARWLGRRVASVTLAVLVALGVAWYGDGAGWWTWEVPRDVLIAAAILVIGWLLSFLGYQRRIFRIRHEYDRRHHAYLAAIDCVEHEAQETVRLASLYDQFLDWAGIIAFMVHRPEGELKKASPRAVDRGIPTPFAMRVVEGIPSQDTLRRSSAVVGRVVFGRSWLSTLYGKYARASMEQLKRQLGLDVDARDPDPDRDITGSPAPRFYLRHEVESGAQAHLWYDEVRAQVHEELLRLPPHEVFGSLVSLDREGPSPPASATEFLSDGIPSMENHDRTALLDIIWTDDAIVESRDPARVSRSFVWAPDHLLEPTERRKKRVEHRPVEPIRLVSGTFMISVIRCDASEGSPATDLRIFGTAEPPPQDDAFDSSVPG